MKLLAVALLSATLVLPAFRLASLLPCVTTDPVVVLGQTLLPSHTVCVPPQ